MGITGLIQFAEAAIKPSSIQELRGKTVAVDAFVLLHKGSYSCSEMLVRGIKTTAMIDYAMKYVKLLQSYCSNIIMVFDGRSLPGKSLTEAKRRENREKAKIKAHELAKNGRHDEAKKEFDKAVVIKHEYAIELMEECRKHHVDCIVAMYEADGQLAYLNKIGLAEYIISEDSDLILFGCKKIVYKLTLDGRCTIFDSEKLHLTFPNFTFEKFRRICILSGCDYLSNLPGIGLSKAKKFLCMTAETDMKKAIPKIPSYLNLKKLTIPDDYVENFFRAEANFKYMYVYDPLKKSMTRLNELESKDDEQYCVNAGELLKPDDAYQLALGNLNPKDMKRVGNYDPLKPLPKSLKRPLVHNIKYKPLFKIWEYDGKKHKSAPVVKSKQQTKIAFAPIVKFKKPEVQKIADEENKVEDEIEMDSLISAYCEATNIPYTPKTTAKRHNSVLNDDASASPRNPFAKRQSLENKSLDKADGCSLIKTLGSKETISFAESKIVSRFFSTKSNEEDPLEIIERIEAAKREQPNNKPLDKIKQKYQINSKEANSDENNVVSSQEMQLTLAQSIDVEEVMSEILEEDTSQKKKPLNLANDKAANNNKKTCKFSKKTSTSSLSSQHKLSKFGFIKTSKVL